jgi:hypothetical protein
MHNGNYEVQIYLQEKLMTRSSLDSFHTLSPIFRQIASDVSWGDKEYHWNLNLPDFVSRWPDVSTQLSQRVTGRTYVTLTSDEQKDFAKLLFTASLSETTTKNALDMLRTGNKAIILYGPPGTGKTHQAKQIVTQLLVSSFSNPALVSKQNAGGETALLDACNFAILFNGSKSQRAGTADTVSNGDQWPTISQSGCWNLIQFHPTYSYHDFIGGIMPELTGNQLNYRRNEGIFKKFCDAAKANRPKPFVLIIDEINRADLSSVFGELMYALEYRNRPVEILHFGSFQIPDNIFLIGTMNSADKSLITFDLALRRRFSFVKLIPDMNVLNEWNAKREFSINDKDLEQLIQKAKRLNLAVVGKEDEVQNGLGLPKDYGIGQAYFMKIGDFCVTEKGDPTQEDQLRITEFAREQLWIYHLEPLLEEYLGAEADAKQSHLGKLRDDFVQGS